MRQRVRLELMANYDIDLQYHPRKINVVPDALSRKAGACMAMQITQQKELLEEMRRMDLMVIRRAIAPGQLMAMQIQPTLLRRSGKLRVEISSCKNTGNKWKPG